MNNITSWYDLSVWASLLSVKMLKINYVGRPQLTSTACKSGRQDYHMQILANLNIFLDPGSEQHIHEQERLRAP